MSLTWDDIVKESREHFRQSWADRISDDDEDENVDHADTGPSYADAVRGRQSLEVDTEPSYADAVRRRQSLRENSLSPKVQSAGAPIGIREIQSIIMRATQTNLSHFHTAGMDDEEAGVRMIPSIADTLNCTYRPQNTSMTFTTYDDIANVRRHLVYSELDSFVSMVRTNFTGLPDRENVWYEASNTSMYDGYILRLYVNYKKLRKFNLTLKDVGKACYDDVDCKWETSPDFMGMIDVGFSTNYVSPILSRMRCQLSGTKEISSCELAYASSPLLPPLRPSGVTLSPLGRKGSRQKQVWNPKGKAEGDRNENVVTVGSNILAASKILKGDHKKTLSSNDVLDVRRRFGIEAAAYALKELVGSAIVSDFMTRTGEVLSFSKHSLEVNRKGLLTSMGFERPKEDIKRELVRSDCQEASKSIYSSIIVGTDPDQKFSLM